MKLKSRLRACTLEDLCEIAAHWRLEPDKSEILESAERLCDYLYPRLQTAAQFKSAFERLEVGEREIVYLLALHGGELPIAELRRRVGLHNAEQMESVLSRLGHRGFAWSKRISDEGHRYDIVGVPEPYVRLIELPPYWKGFLGSFLQDLGLAELKAIVRNALGERYEGRRKQVLVHYARARLTDPKELHKIIEALAPERRELFDYVLKQRGSCSRRELLDGGAHKKFSHDRSEGLDFLTQHSALVFISRGAENHYDDLLMVPRDLRHVIHRGFRRDERTLGELSRADHPGRKAQPDSAFRPSVILDNSQNILRDLAIVLAYIRANQVRILNSGGVGRNNLKKIIPLLSHNKTVKYVSFLSLFAMSKKLLIPVGDRWRVSKTVADWLADAKRCFRELFEFWLTTNDWNEEYVEGDVVHVDAYPRNLIGITEMRKLVLRVIEKVPAETWIDFDTFADSLLPQVAIEIPGRFEHAPSDKNARHTKLIMESLLAEPIYWFGIVTLGVADLESARELGSRQDPVLPRPGGEAGGAMASGLLVEEQYRFSFKKTDTGRAMFDGRYTEPERLFTKYEEPGLPYSEQVELFTVQPNLEIVTPPDLSLDRFYLLLGCAEVKKVDIMTTLEITRESLRSAMEQGRSGADILKFLQEGSRKELSETVAQLIEECDSRHGEIDVGLAGGYIVAGNPMHVEEMRANPRISRYVKDVFNDQVIVLNRTVDLNKVSDELKKTGFMPRVASETLHVTGEGLFHMTLRREELYELLAVLGFAQSLDEDFDGAVFEEKVRPMIERLTGETKGDFKPEYYTKPLIKAFQANYEKQTGKRKDEEKRKLKKQVNRLLTRAPSRREPIRFTGENPTSDPAALKKLFKFAIEHEMQVKIHYQRSTGEAIDEAIEPESIQAGRVYAFCPQSDEHRLYALNRIEQAAI